MELIESALKSKKNSIEYGQKLLVPQFKQSFSAEELFTIVTQHANPEKRVEMDEHNEAILKNMCCYFTNDNRFLTDESRNFQKGILLSGDVGVGKSHLMRAFINNPKQAYIVKSVKKIAMEYKQKDNDMATLQAHSKINFDKGMNQLTGKNDFSWCFDDLGIEENMSNYGNTSNVMLDILEMCYDNRTTVHLTTNLNFEALELRYGVRLLDRVLQMFNVFQFPESAKSKRK